MHSHASDSRALAIAFVLTLTFMIVEIIGGLVSGSLALLADAAHMATDAAALGLALWASWQSRIPANEVHSFGYRRHQTMAAFINGFALLLLAGWIIVEAVQRLLTPQPVMAGTMLSIALLGLVVNIIVFAILHRGQKNINVRAAAAHVLGDLLGSIAAILAAVIIYLTGWIAADPLLSILIAILILYTGRQLLREAGHVLLEGIPPGFDEERLKAELPVAVPDILDVHHVHAWALTPDKPFFLTMHATIDEQADADSILRHAKAFVQTEFEIDHVTIQIERRHCPDHENC